MGTSAVPGSLFDRSYSYDQVGNVTRILDQRLNIAQRFRYDPRDRLTHASALDGSSNSISIQARGTYADGWPVMRLRVNGTTVKEWTVGSTSWATYSHTLATPVSDADTVDVEFVNDYGNAGANRDLFVQTITVGSQVIPANARTVSYDPGAVDGKDVLASDGTMWWNGALRLTERFSYDVLGNLTNNASLAITYGATGNGTGTGPHQARTVGGASLSYDSNGNLTSGSGRSLSWTPTNMPASITSGGVTETYAYTGDGERYRRVRGSVTTLFLEGIYEETVGGAFRRYYTLNGQVVALRERSGTVTTTSYPHGDHLGSVSLVSTSSGALASQQEYDAWGQVRLLATQTQLPIQHTGRNYTGQERDGTGLLYYKARYYDPAIGRFLSADTVIPGNASGGMDGVAVKPLTVGFHETPFLTKLNQENQFGFWFELSGQERQQVGSPWGPMNPQALNRYAYVLNNPLKYTDPSGHHPCGALLAGGPIGAGVAAGCAAFMAGVWFAGYLATQATVAALENNDPPGLLPASSDTGGQTASPPNPPAPTPGPGDHTPRDRVLQTGGNTIRNSTANELNKAHGLRLHQREWGRALEGLKSDLRLPNNHHGKITEFGNYIDGKTGKILGNLLDYLP
ncbi:MAG: RHS repeat-associated core domain-containing protein [Oscillochloridaceae bacterium umkhey_bin13]